MLANFYVKQGQSVLHRTSKKQGSILRVYPFTDKPNIMVKFKDGTMRSFFRSDLLKSEVA